MTLTEDVANEGNPVGSFKNTNFKGMLKRKYMDKGEVIFCHFLEREITNFKRQSIPGKTAKLRSSTKY